MHLTLGLDLGAASDYTASTLLELVHVIAPGDSRPPDNRFEEVVPPAPTARTGAATRTAASSTPGTSGTCGAGR